MSEEKVELESRAAESRRTAVRLGRQVECLQWQLEVDQSGSPSSPPSPVPDPVLAARRPNAAPEPRRPRCGALPGGAGCRPLVPEEEDEGLGDIGADRALTQQ